MAAISVTMTAANSGHRWHVSSERAGAPLPYYEPVCAFCGTHESQAAGLPCPAATMTAAPTVIGRIDYPPPRFDGTGRQIDAADGGSDREERSGGQYR